MPEAATGRPGPTLDQRRAAHAWDVVQRVKQKQGPHQGQEPKKFGGQAKKLPTRIMAAGLGQALAFLKAKGYAPGLLAELTAWVGVPDRTRPERTKGPSGENRQGRFRLPAPGDGRGAGLPRLA